MQIPKGLIYLIGELELDKWNDWALNNSIDSVFIFYWPIFYIWPLHMTSIYLFPFSKIIYLNTFSEFLNFIHVTFVAKYFTQSCWAFQKASAILHATFFYNSKISIHNESANLFGEDNFSLRKRLSLIKKSGFWSPY